MSKLAVESVAQSAAGESFDAELEAYNFAFCALELPWRWDADTLLQLRRIASDKDVVGAYVERHQPHLLRVYEKDFLRNLVLSTKARYRSQTPRSTR